MTRRSLVSRPCSACLLVVLPLVVFSGCSRFDYSDKVYIDRDAFKSNPPRSLAIVPFSNASGVSNADEVARGDIFEELADLSYLDVEPSRVDAALSHLAVEHNIEPDEVPPPLIRQAGIADAILSGQVKSVSKRWALIYSHIRVEMLLELVDTRTNKTIYRNEASGTSRRSAAPTSIWEIFTGAWSTITHLRQKEIDETLQEFAERLEEKFPEPQQTSGEAGLYIRNPLVALPRNPLQPGDVIAVQFQGSPGKNATMDIGGVEERVQIPEVSPGRYAVKYRIPAAADTEYSVVHLRLRQEPGAQVEVTLHQEPFAIRSGATAQTR